MTTQRERQHSRGVRNIFARIEEAEKAERAQQASTVVVDLPVSDDVVTGVKSIVDAIADAGLDRWSKRTVETMLARGEIPAWKVGGRWATRRSVLTDFADTIKRARLTGLCLCRFCPCHGRSS